MADSKDYAWYQDGVKQIFAPKHLHPIVWGILQPTPADRILQETLKAISRRTDDEFRAQYYGSFDMVRPERAPETVQPPTTSAQIRQEMRRANDIIGEPLFFSHHPHTGEQWWERPTLLFRGLYGISALGEERSPSPVVDAAEASIEAGEVGLRCCGLTFEQFVAYMDHRRTQHKM